VNEAQDVERPVGEEVEEDYRNQDHVADDGEDDAAADARRADRRGEAVGPVGVEVLDQELAQVARFERDVDAHLRQPRRDSAVDPLDQERQLLVEERQLLRQDRHDQEDERGQRDQRCDLDQDDREQARHAARRELLDGGVERIGEHGADHERRQHRPEQPEQDDRNDRDRGPVEDAPLRRRQAHRRASWIRVAPAVNAGATGRRDRARAGAR
jgi:hypothetical protein